MLAGGGTQAAKHTSTGGVRHYFKVGTFGGKSTNVPRAVPAGPERTENVPPRVAKVGGHELLYTVRHKTIAHIKKGVYQYPAGARPFTPRIPRTRVEALLHWSKAACKGWYSREVATCEPEHHDLISTAIRDEDLVAVHNHCSASMDSTFQFERFTLQDVA